MLLYISLITINYSNFLGLQKTIFSVLAQTYLNFEFIIIDGGSTDGSKDLIDYYKDKLAYWVSEPDNGIYHAMNKGIAKASGDYLLFLNAGDVFVNNHVIENMVTSCLNAPICIGNMLKRFPDGKIFRDKGSSLDLPSLLMFYKGTINHSSAFIKRTLFTEYGLYNETLKIVSDWKWYLQVVGMHGVEVSYKDIDVSIFDMSGISNTQSSLEQDERRMVLESLLPAPLLADFEKHHFDIERMQRIRRFPIVKYLIFFTERVLFKWEKYVLRSNSRIQ
jgi:glycosyltransferase involved in cell wall biosynthesis